ncbi:MAG: hypothetical protein J6386_01005 [Candidatus Synoicihabitans palmerolidicus]|nr:hypothetical protein [Candidatus Synoicihabitans palmerolidicus]
MAAVLLTIVTNTLGIWEKSASALALQNRAQLVLDCLAVDLESAVVRQDGGAWIRVEDVDNTMRALHLFANTRTTSGDAADPCTIREVEYLTSTDDEAFELYRWEGTAEAALASTYAF